MMPAPRVAPTLQPLPHINWRSMPGAMPGTKPRKVPWDAAGGVSIDHLDPANWIDAATARARAGGDVHVGQVLPREPSGWFLLDLDNCRDAASGVAEWAQAVLDSMPGAWVEVSHSGTGLHVMGRCDPARVGDLRNKWTPPGAPVNAAEFYHAGRFIACGHGGVGDLWLDWTDTLARLVPMREAAAAVELPEGGPVTDYTGPADDAELMDLMRHERLRAGGPLAPGLFAIDFFDTLDRLRPLIHADKRHGRDPNKPAPWDFDGSGVDMALMNHLAYYTGCDVPRMIRLHAQSVMGQRDKAHDRPAYVLEAAQKAARDKLAARSYLNRPTVDSIMRAVRDDPTTAVARLAHVVAALQPAERDTVLAGCRGYGIKTQMDRAVANAVRDRRRAATEQAGLIASKNGEPIQNIENVRRVLTTSPDWAGSFALNDFDSAVWLMRPEPKQMKDADIWPVISDLQSGPMPNVQKNIVWDGVEAAATLARFHPVREYLNSLVWDGKPRLASLFTDLFPGRADSTEALEYLTLAGRRFCIGAVARIFEPGCKVDTMPVLIGPQGAGKSSGLRALAGAQWFGDDIKDVGSTASKEYMRGMWIVEMGELEGMRGRETTTVKAFLSTTSDRFREAYGRKSGSILRQTVFAGTTNDETFLTDATGGRRFWPIHLRPDARVDVDRITRERDQILAEAVAAYRAGERWWFDEGENHHLRDQQEAARHRDIDEETLRAWLRVHPDRVTAGMAAHWLWKVQTGDTSQSKRVARYLRAAGWEPVATVNGTRHWGRTRRAEPYEPTPERMPPHGGNVTPLHRP